MIYFVGQEIVRYREQPVWSMSYAGGVIPSASDMQTRAIYAFLRLALRHGTVEQPYRGPATLNDASFTYTNESQGRLKAFWGVEEISHHGEKVYELRYAGGFLG
jgi:hypothetical protein